MATRGQWPIDPQGEVGWVSLGRVLVLAAMAGGMGWGIRGQYGHETGAMIAGLLVGLVLVLCLGSGMDSLSAARAVALMTIGVSFGGSMTYGQTIGLTQNEAMIGNTAALRWGMLGLLIKGGIWIGFAGVFLGMGLSGKRYGAWEMMFVVAGLLVLLFVGLRLLNGPFEPGEKILPRFYFSADWRWEPEAVDLRPRRERWGGLLLALIGLLVYVGLIRRDRLSLNLGLWGVLGGALGFPGGQCLQAGHAWNRAWFREGWFASLDPLLNWWNLMEITFGLIWGFTLALGCWLNRKRIVVTRERSEPEFRAGVEWAFLAVYLSALTAWQFLSVPALDAVADHAITMGLIPLVAVVGGRLWPYLLALPIVALPIAGKTFGELCLQETQLPPITGALLYLALPLIVTTWMALRYAGGASRGESGAAYARAGLLLTTWLYYGLNFAFFRYPWPWETPTGRTPSAVILAVCAVGLTLGAAQRQAITAPKVE